MCRCRDIVCVGVGHCLWRYCLCGCRAFFYVGMFVIVDVVCFYCGCVGEIYCSYGCKGVVYCFCGSGLLLLWVCFIIIMDVDYF